MLLKTNIDSLDREFVPDILNALDGAELSRLNDSILLVDKNVKQIKKFLADKGGGLEYDGFSYPFY